MSEAAPSRIRRAPMAVDLAALTFAMIVLIVGSVALMLKMMIFALAIDDWWELREMPKTHPERMVADDEASASAGCVLSVAITVVIGVVWVLGALEVAPVAVLRITIAIGVLLQAVVAVYQGGRGMFFRRKLTQILNHSRRPVGPPVSAP